MWCICNIIIIHIYIIYVLIRTYKSKRIVVIVIYAYASIAYDIHESMYIQKYFTCTTENKFKLNENWMTYQLSQFEIYKIFDFV